MNIEQRIKTFLQMDYKVQLDRWEELLSIGKDFLASPGVDRLLAKKIAEAILYHRSLMGSSKAYESAFEIDSELLWVSIPIARIAYGESNELIEYLTDGVYYSDILPDRFNKSELENEIIRIRKNS